MAAASSLDQDGIVCTTATRSEIQSMKTPEDYPDIRAGVPGGLCAGVPGRIFSQDRRRTAATPEEFVKALTRAGWLAAAHTASIWRIGTQLLAEASVIMEWRSITPAGIRVPVTAKCTS